jgi:hypothetical protein
MPSTSADRVFCRVQYGNFRTDQQQAVCRELLNDLGQLNLSTGERQRQKALLHDTLGIMLTKDPRDIVIRMQKKQEQHDTAIQIRQNLIISTECDYLDKMLIQLDSCISLQRAGYARADLSCSSSLSPERRIELAQEAKKIHSDSVAEQQQLLNLLGIPPDISGDTPGMLSTQFDCMLRHLRIQQLSRQLISPMAARKQDMLNHVDTQMDIIAQGFERIPQHCLDVNVIALKEGMLPKRDFLKKQIMDERIQGIFLGNSYMPE